LQHESNLTIILPKNSISEETKSAIFLLFFAVKLANK